MISHTCFTPPTGVPVDLMTHCAAPPPIGACRDDPAGQLVLGSLADAAEFATPFEKLTADSESAANVAVSTAPVRALRRRIFGIRTRPP